MFQTNNISTGNLVPTIPRKTIIDEPLEDNGPLFYMPGKRGIYSPRQGRASNERINAFRNVGR